jgi:hypothetical protein
VSIKKGVKLNPGIIAPLSSYCKPFVPLRVSVSPVPLTSPAETYFTAKPAFYAK